MASLSIASTHPASLVGFGSWLREQRQSRGSQRELAAVADMDSSHLGKAERGKRLPTTDQAMAIAHHLGIEEPEMRRRLFAARFVQECGGDLELAHEAAQVVLSKTAGDLVKNSGGNVRIRK